MGNGNTCPSLRGITNWAVMFHQLSFEGCVFVPVSVVRPKRNRLETYQSECSKEQQRRD